MQSDNSRTSLTFEEAKREGEGIVADANAQHRQKEQAGQGKLYQENQEGKQKAESESRAAVKAIAADEQRVWTAKVQDVNAHHAQKLSAIEKAHSRTGSKPIDRKAAYAAVQKKFPVADRKHDYSAAKEARPAKNVEVERDRQSPGRGRTWER